MAVSRDTLTLLIPVPATLSILLVMSVIFKRMGGMGAASSPKRGEGKFVPGKNPFRNRPSRFDTFGNLLTAWKPLDKEAVLAEQEWMGARRPPPAPVPTRVRRCLAVLPPRACPCVRLCPNYSNSCALARAVAALCGTAVPQASSTCSSS